MIENCYSTEIECQIYDNQSFRTRGHDIYDLLLNAASGCCVNAKYIMYGDKLYGRTFSENDPIKAVTAGLAPSAARFENQIDAGYFKPGLCDDITFSSNVNVDQINLYDYQLESTKTQYVSSDDIINPQTVHEKKNESKGELWVRNTLSTKIEPIHKLLPSINEYPAIYNNIVDFDVIYDTIFVYSDESMYIDRLNYNYTTGEFVQAPTAPVVVSRSNKNSVAGGLIRPFFNELAGHVIYGRTDLHDGQIVFEMYKYDLDKGVTSPVYAAQDYLSDMDRLSLPDDIINEYNIREIGTPHLTYNETIGKYTITTTARLSANLDTLLDNTDTEYQSRIFTVLVYNFKETGSGLKLIDCIIYHPENKKQLNYKVSPKDRVLHLTEENKSSNIVLDDITDSHTTITINAKHVKVRDSKLKEIRCNYKDRQLIKQRLPINDMYLADIENIHDMVEGVKGHRCGGATDFASPRYQPIELDLDLDLFQVEVVEFTVQAIYFDGHVDEWLVTGIARPLPIDLLMGDLRLIDTKSFTTDNNTCLLKLIFESQNPQTIAEFVLRNDGIPEKRITQINLSSITTSITAISATPTPTPTGYVD